jgi:hypothetical protein
LVVEFVRVLAIEGVTHIYRQIHCPSGVEFVRVLAIKGVSHIY